MITKLDLMDKGTDAKAIFENKLLPLKKGYVGVVNRSQADINENKNIKKALAAEKEFFMKSVYRSMIDRMGTKYLQQVLNRELEKHIKSKIPEIKSELHRKRREVEEELDSLDYDGSDKDSSRTISKLLNKFVDENKSIIDGAGDSINTSKIKGGFQINRCFYHDFVIQFDESLDIDEAIDKEIGIAIINKYGVNNAIFIPQEVLNVILR